MTNFLNLAKTKQMIEASLFEKASRVLSHARKNRKAIMESVLSASNGSRVDEMMTNNPSHGYHGQHSSEVADKMFAAAHASVSKTTGADPLTVRNYLDSVHGRHLVGLEHDAEYVKKDFSKFKKTYKPELFEGEVVLSEMRDAPDNSKYPLSRRAVERLLSVADYHIEGDAIPPSDTCEDGRKKVLWYPYGDDETWTADIQGDEHVRPAKLMPYDYEFAVYNTPDVNKQYIPGQIQGDDQTTFDLVAEAFITKHNNEHVGDDPVHQALHQLADHASGHGGDLVVSLADGNEVFLDAHAISHMKTRSMLGELHKNMGNIDEFSSFVAKAYGITPPVGHEPIVNPDPARHDLPPVDQDAHRDSHSPDQF